MPSIDLAITPGGPHVTVAIALSAPHRDALIAAGKTPPNPVLGTFLIDTGASGTVIDPQFMAPLGLTPKGAVMVQTPSTNGLPVACPTYDVMLIILSGNPAVSPFLVDALPVMEASLRSQGIDGLIGRDVLAKCVLIYNGISGNYVLSY
jgi:hypothetical protein